MSQQYAHKVRLGVVLIHQEKLLLVRQNNRPFWVFPGGTLEVGEGLQACAEREMKEEIALDVKMQKVLYLADFLNQQPGQPQVKHTVDVFMLAEYIDGEPTMTLDENLNEIGFFTLEEAARLAVEPQLVMQRLLQDWPLNFEAANGLYLGTYGAAAKE